MARAFKYTSEKNDVPYAEFYTHDDGHLEWTVLPEMTGDGMTALIASNTNAVNRLHQLDLSKITVKKV